MQRRESAFFEELEGFNEAQRGRVQNEGASRTSDAHEDARNENVTAATAENGVVALENAAEQPETPETLLLKARETYAANYEQKKAGDDEDELASRREKYFNALAQATQERLAAYELELDTEYELGEVGYDEFKAAKDQKMKRFFSLQMSGEFKALYDERTLQRVVTEREDIASRTPSVGRWIETKLFEASQGYRNLSLKKKLVVSGALLAGGITAGAIGGGVGLALATFVGGGRIVQRTLAGGAAGIGVDALLKKRYDAKLQEGIGERQGKIEKGVAGELDQLAYEKALVPVLRSEFFGKEGEESRAIAREGSKRGRTMELRAQEYVNDKIQAMKEGLRNGEQPIWPGGNPDNSSDIIRFETKGSSESLIEFLALRQGGAMALLESNGRDMDKMEKRMRMKRYFFAGLVGTLFASGATGAAIRGLGELTGIHPIDWLTGQSVEAAGPHGVRPDGIEQSRGGGRPIPEGGSGAIGNVPPASEAMPGETLAGVAPPEPGTEALPLETQHIEVLLGETPATTFEGTTGAPNPAIGETPATAFGQPAETFNPTTENIPGEQNVTGETVSLAENGEPVATIHEGGNVWNAARALVNADRITEEQFLNAWGHSTIDINDIKVPIHEVSLVHADDSLTFVPDADGGGHFEIAADSKIALGTGVHPVAAEQIVVSGEENPVEGYVPEDLSTTTNIPEGMGVPQTAHMGSFGGKKLSLQDFFSTRRPSQFDFKNPLASHLSAASEAPPSGAAAQTAEVPTPPSIIEREISKELGRRPLGKQIEFIEDTMNRLRKSPDATPYLKDYLEVAKREVLHIHENSNSPFARAILADQEAMIRTAESFANDNPKEPYFKEVMDTLKNHATYKENIAHYTELWKSTHLSEQEYDKMKNLKVGDVLKHYGRDLLEYLPNEKGLSAQEVEHRRALAGLMRRMVGDRSLPGSVRGMKVEYFLKSFYVTTSPASGLIEGVIKEK